METDFDRFARLLNGRLRLTGAVRDDQWDSGDDAAQIEEILLEPALLSTTAPHADTELVRRIQWGDMSAFEELFLKYQGHIYRTAFAITRDAGAAEEVLQDCFYRTYLNIMNITGEGSLSPWLHRVAVNLSCNAIKKRRLRVEPIDDMAEASYATEPRHSPEALAEQSELRVRMRDAVNALPLKHRVVVTLHYLQDFSLPEISYILNVPLGTVKSRLHHARKALRAQLEGQQTAQGVTYDPAY